MPAEYTARLASTGCWCGCRCVSALIFVALPPCGSYQRFSLTAAWRIGPRRGREHVPRTAMSRRAAQPHQGDMPCPQHRFHRPGVAFLPLRRPREPSACFPSIWPPRPTAAPSVPSMSTFPKPNSSTCADGCWRRDGPTRETVADDSQGVQLATMQKLARYWTTDYDWRKCETKLKALPHFITEIDGVDIHFIHVRSKHEDALPLIVTHGWPGSIIEQLKIIDPLTNPTAHGAVASDAFHLVIPSIPGYGFSGKPTATGWEPVRIARAWTVADETARIHPVCGARRRLGGCHYGADGASGASGTAGHSHQHARHRSSRRFQGASARRPGAVRPLGRRTACL